MKPPIVRQEISVEPFFKWVGGKYHQTKIHTMVKLMYSHYTDTHIWVEPFCGSLGMTLRVNPRVALCGDLNRHAINFYNFLQTEEALTFDWNFLADYTDECQFYAYRKIFNSNIDRPDSCILFWWLNQAAFNGLIRFNSKGEFNVGAGVNYQGDLNKICIPSLEKIEKFQKLTENWRFFPQSWRDTIKTLEGIEENCFVYCDPPYYQTFTNYDKTGFDWEQQEILAIKLSKLKCPVLLSNSHSPNIIVLYEKLGFRIKEIAAKRSVSGDGSRNKVSEVLAYKNCG